MVTVYIVVVLAAGFSVLCALVLIRTIDVLFGPEGAQSHGH